MFDAVFITGGSRGIGAACVREFSKAGKRVAFTYKNSEDAALLLAKETGAFCMYCDVSDENSVSCAVKAAKEKIGKIEVLVNNAGIANQGLILDMHADIWRNVQSVNLDGMFYATKAVLPDMTEKRHGRIINISSVWGRIGASNEAAYSASKAAGIGFTKSLAKEYASCGITVNAVAPGVVDTDMNGCYTEEELLHLKEEIPLGRFAEPAEIAYLVHFLASERAAYITGQVIGIDGGFAS